MKRQRQEPTAPWRLVQRPPPTTILTAGVLVAANLGVALGTLTGALDLGEIMLLYWAESAIIGVFSIVKMAIAARWGALALVPFFCIHAGMFMGAHLLFLNVLFLSGDGGLNPFSGLFSSLASLAIPLAILAASHAISFIVHTLRGGERSKNPAAAMGSFYGRIVVMHVTIIFGGFLSVLLGSPGWAVLLLVILKTGADAFSHLLQHKPRTDDPSGAVANPS